MDYTEILKHVDHTNLKVNSTTQEILKTVNEGIEYKTASVCIAPFHVKAACDFSEGRVPICTVIGFPNGYNTKEVKLFETEKALRDGAAEIDMVINQLFVKERQFDELVREINDIKRLCGSNILKVIVETCILGEEDKIFVSQAVSASDADYIKSSTGFSSYGATIEDIKILLKYCKNKKVKASGGIKTIEDALAYLSLGVDRLGTSSIVKIIKERTEKNAGHA